MSNAEQPSAEMRAPALDLLDPLQPLLSRLSITDYDLLLVGDGSGNAWDKACGWAGILIDRQTRGRRACYGAADKGSINFAETMPYLQLLSWYDQHYGKARLERNQTIRVNIVTDSQVVANWGTAAMTPGQVVPRKFGAYWSAMRYFRSIGYVCQFHWAPRQTSRLNWAADLIAGLARVAMIELPGQSDRDAVTACQIAAASLAQLDFKSPDGSAVDIYQLN